MRAARIVLSPSSCTSARGLRLTRAAAALMPPESQVLRLFGWSASCSQQVCRRRSTCGASASLPKARELQDACVRCFPVDFESQCTS